MAEKSKEEVYAKRQDAYKEEKKEVFKEARKEAKKKNIIPDKKAEEQKKEKE
ncbi:MAG TPA: hypothetical protein H9829_09910 [Candidatus Tetragenococcus pullicola]|nr:hypothetical protein [Candidatus Tetragenococcus pullicola]